MSKILEKIHYKLGAGPVLSKLAEELSLSELNTFLLELFRLKARQAEPAHLLRQFSENRFTRPAAVDTLAIRQTELDWLRYARERQFQPLTLSPLAPLATCSAIAHVDQNNVLSAVRGTEVVSDATNVLALQIAQDAKGERDKNAIFRYATTHRHVRGQAFDNPNFTAHFAVLCLASGGWDSGNYAFELSQLNEHLRLLLNLLLRHFPKEQLFIRFYRKRDADVFMERMENYPNGIWKNLPYEFQDDLEHEYYHLIQSKVFLRLDGSEIDLADGGPVNWTQQLLSNKKHRLFISGIGLELVHKLGDRRLGPQD
ncbi:MAG: hypothetical protein KDD19_25600 [Phaeodactylibacter sp.]|nr:hypothetical protein [Phaeodactylibacter sp.]MCB9051362.1 hypothetical protein [Lewinellaceae bacterium]